MEGTQNKSSRGNEDKSIDTFMEVLGLGNVTPWKRMVEDLVELVLKLEKSEKLWKKGCDVDEFLGKNMPLGF